MKKVVNYLRGSVEVEAAGPFPERFLNLCAQEGVPFWGVEWHGGTRVHLRVPRRARAGLDALGERAGCALTDVERTGLPVFLGRFRRRYALLTGLALSLLSVLLMTQFVLVVDVSGNERLPSAEILSTLRRLGVRPGAFGPGLDTDYIKQKALVELQDLAWLSINLHGARAEVLVRERVEPPERPDESEHGDIVAELPGVVTRIEVLDGEAGRKVGEPVAAGDVLIRGNVLLEGPLYSEHDVGWRQVRAQGRVEARTWRTLEASIPLTAGVKQYTGAEQDRWYLEWMGRRINFYGKSGISFPQYDKISRSWNAETGGGWTLPLSLGRETLREYDLIPAEVDAAAAEEMLRTRLEQVLRAQLGSGTISRSEYTAVRAGDILTVTLRAECREEIGRFVPFDGPA